MTIRLSFKAYKTEVSYGLRYAREVQIVVKRQVQSDKEGSS